MHLGVYPTCQVANQILDLDLVRHRMHMPWLLMLALGCGVSWAPWVGLGGDSFLPLGLFLDRRRDNLLDLRRLDRRRRSLRGSLA
jgi:hypothetical protein